MLNSILMRIGYLDEHDPGFGYFRRYVTNESLTAEEKEKLDRKDFPLFLAELLSNNTIRREHLWFFRQKHDFDEDLASSIKIDNPDHDKVLENAFFDFIEKTLKPRIVEVCNYSLRQCLNGDYCYAWENFIMQLLLIYRGTYEPKGSEQLKRKELDELIVYPDGENHGQTKKRKLTLKEADHDKGTV